MAKKIFSDLSGEQVRTALENAGFVPGLSKGIHIVMRRYEPPARVVVPDMPNLRTATLRRIIAEAGLTAEDFNELLMR